MATITLGQSEHSSEAKTIFNMHVALAQARSPFLNACFKDCWNGETKQVDLSEHSPEAFCIFTAWAYINDISGPVFFEGRTTSQAIELIGKVYRLAHHLQCSQFANQLIDVCIDHFEEHDSGFEMEAITDFHDLGLSGTPLFRWAVKDGISHFTKNPDSYDWEVKDLQVFEKIQNQPAVVGLSFSTIQAYNRHQTTRADNRKNRCEWHEHMNGTESSCLLRPSTRLGATMKNLIRTKSVKGHGLANCYHCIRSKAPCAVHATVQEPGRWEFQQSFS